jgi:hypothetical protein
MHYSTCALIQRAVSPGSTSFNKECLESSRAALVAHMRANAQFNKKGQEELWSGYVHWSILQAPFTPYVTISHLRLYQLTRPSFIVIFCNSIQKADASDLSSLSDFVSSLESCRTISEGADKLYKMCHLFLQVAKLYIMAKTQDAAPSQPQSVPPNNQPDYYTTTDGAQLDLNAMAQFNPYLSALGLMPDSAWPMAGNYAPNAPTSADMSAYSQGQTLDNVMEPGPMGLGFGAPHGNSNPVQDWFSGSRYLMNLMEAGDDLQMPDLDM